MSNPLIENNKPGNRGVQGRVANATLTVNKTHVFLSQRGGRGQYGMFYPGEVGIDEKGNVYLLDEDVTPFRVRDYAYHMEGNNFEYDPDYTITFNSVIQ